MGEVGFVAGTRKAYLREYDKFVSACGNEAGNEATRHDMRNYIAELKRGGASVTRYSHAAAVLRFFLEEVCGESWEAPPSPLRRRMVEDMQLHRFSAKTQSSYLCAVQNLSEYYNRTPAELDEAQIRRYFVHLTCERKLARATVTIALCGIKFFYEKTLKRDWSLTGVPVPKREKKVPVVLTRTQVNAILLQLREVRHRACLALSYACGLRLGEACRVRVTDIDRARGLLHVRGKGARERYVPLPEGLLPLLEKCWLSHRNPEWLFPWVGRGGRRGRITDRHVPLSSVQQAFRKALKASRVRKKVSVHSLRHAYATHLMEANVPLPQIQKWLGHASQSTTRIYAHLTEKTAQVSAQIVDKLMNGLDHLA
jgi:site-specific recombinase XerD